MTAPAERAEARRAYSGPMLLERGFRPFFLAAGLWAVIGLALWLATLTGTLGVPSAFDAATWHAHALIFGFVGAAVAGFLLTAVPNWTGRLPVRGAALGGLVALWLAGRLAVGFGQVVGPGIAAAVDLAFWIVLGGAIAREVIAGNNRRNLPVVAAIGVFAAADAAVHAGTLGLPTAGPVGLRLGIGTVVVLISLIGGRIVPSFTRNWLAKRGGGPLPRSVPWLDRVTVVGTALAMLAWSGWPGHPATGAALLALAALHLARLSGWRGERTLAEPLVWVLHLGYAWVPVGLALAGLAALAPAAVPPVAGLHALTAGAMATMVLAVATRATLGHSGRPLTAGGATVAIYALVTVAALSRLGAAFLPTLWVPLLHASATAWIAAFGLFTLIYGAIALRG
ncbi:MAG: NnrS family protein [Azospirillaceae bacterium]